MAKLLSEKNMKNRILYRMAFEIKYEYGYKYLDHCGSALNKLLEVLPAWSIPKADPDQTLLVKPEFNMKLAFNSNRFILDQIISTAYPQIKAEDGFFNTLEIASEIILNLFEITILSRVGYRMWTMFESSSEKETLEMLKKIKLFHIDKTNLPQGTLKSYNLGFTMDRGKYQINFKLGGGEQDIKIDRATLEAASSSPKEMSISQKKILINKLKAQKRIKQFPQYFLMVDTDYIIEDPILYEGYEFKDFASSKYQSNPKVVDEIFKSGKDK